jgi:hypothetical protein
MALSDSCPLSKDTYIGDTLNSPIGFVLVTHNKPEQTLLLCNRLTEIFDSPPIALHHDFGQTDLNITMLSSNVRVVKNWHKTAWGRIGVVEANMKALRLLCESFNPDWIVSLSNACYPIKTADEILASLASRKVDAYMECRLIEYNAARDHSNRKSLESADRWLFDCVERYIATRISSYKVMALLGKPHQAVYLKSPLFSRHLTPFRNGLRCYAGEAWYTVNRKAAAAILRSTPFSNQLYKHYKDRNFPEESYYQTILMNSPGIKLENNCLTYTEWTPTIAHPKMLGYEAFPRLVTTPKLFARKFAMEHEVLHALDEEVSTACSSVASVFG